MGLIQTIFKKSGERFPKPEYLLFALRRDDVQSPIVGCLDVAYRNYSFQPEVPWLLNLTVKMEKDNGTGGPTPEEGKILDEFEDILSEKFRTLTRVHWVGRLTYDGVRDLMWQIDNPEPIHAYLQEMIEQVDNLRHFEYGILQNPQWETFHAILSDVDKKGSIINCSDISGSLSDL